MITITIKTDNEAFEGDGHALEVARILRELADKAERFHRFQMAGAYDSNGNKVGRVTLTGRDRVLA